MLDSVRPEPQPTEGAGRPVYELVMEDIRARAEAGKAKYGMYLRPWNGRRSTVDAYQEALDLCMYLRQKLEEEGHSVR